MKSRTLSLHADHRQTLVIRRQQEAVKRAVKAVGVAALPGEHHSVGYPCGYDPRLYQLHVLAGAGHYKHAVFALFQYLTEYIDEKSLILLRAESSDMSENRRALWNFQLLAHLAALLFAVAVFFRVDGIRHYTDPAVLLLDEITANLDAETEERVLEALRRASEGRTVLSVSHRVYENLGGRTVEIKPQGQ